MQGLADVSGRQATSLHRWAPQCRASRSARLSGPGKLPCPPPPTLHPRFLTCQYLTSVMHTTGMHAFYASPAYETSPTWVHTMQSLSVAGHFSAASSSFGGLAPQALDNIHCCQPITTHMVWMEIFFHLHTRGLPGSIWGQTGTSWGFSECAERETLSSVQ